MKINKHQATNPLNNHKGTTPRKRSLKGFFAALVAAVAGFGVYDNKEEINEHIVEPTTAYVAENFDNHLMNLDIQTFTSGNYEFYNMNLKNGYLNSLFDFSRKDSLTPQEIESINIVIESINSELNEYMGIKIRGDGNDGKNLVLGVQRDLNGFIEKIEDKFKIELRKIIV